MNVGILTFHFANNPGALLQAYGLCKRVEELGHTVRVIDYTPPNCRLPWWQGWGLRHGTPGVGLGRLRFDRFRSGRLPLTQKSPTAGGLRSLATQFNAVIVGSDQVWNGNIVQADAEQYFLGFVGHDSCRRISYAACFGERDQPPRTIAAAGRLLPCFDRISVRNEMSAALVRELSGRDSQVVLDPSLLHDYRGLVPAAPKPAGYIAVYYVSGAHAAAGRDIVREVRRRLRLPVISFGTDRRRLHGDRDILSAGPLEWIRLLHQASFICTDSFHATAFALKFRKPFLAWPGLRVGRLESLLTLCGLRDRLLATDPANIADLATTAIDFDGVFARLAPHVTRSLAFLESALSQHGSAQKAGRAAGILQPRQEISIAYGPIVRVDGAAT